MTLRVGQLQTNLSVSASQSIRVNSAGNAWEAYTPSTGLTIGSAVSGGGANRVLYEDASQNLAASSGLTYNGTRLHVSGGNPKSIVEHSGGSWVALFSGTSLSLFQFDSTKKFGIQAATSQDDDGSLRYAQIIFGNTRNTVFGDMDFGASDEGARLQVRSTSEQMRVGYDTSNYYSTTVGSTGSVTFDAVGSGAKFVFSDNVEMTDAKNIVLGTTTGTQIGTAITQKLGFYGSTAIVQPEVTGSKGGNTALANLMTALGNLGLVKDSTT